MQTYIFQSFYTLYMYLETYTQLISFIVFLDYYSFIDR